VWRMLLEQHPPHSAHGLRLGSPGHQPAIIRCRKPYAVIYDLALLKIGIKVPETC
jgi:hypothetical protein